MADSSDSSSAEGSSEETQTSSSSRKRQMHSASHKKNVRKLKRNRGEEYQTNENILVKAKEFHNTDCGCSKQCIGTMTEDERRDIFTLFWAIGDYSKQNAYISGLVKRLPVQQHRPRNSAKGPKSVSYRYFLNSSSVSKPICKQFFLDTFQVSNGRVARALKKEELGRSPGEDLRGRRPPANKISEEVRNGVRRHIKMFPAFESHYSRAKNPNRKFLSPDLDIRKMYTLYKEECAMSSVNPVKEHFYRSIFNNEFNLSFHHPRKDTCQKCDSLCLQIKATEDEAKKHELKTQHELHLRKAEKARQSLKEDTEKCKQDENIMGFTFDLQKALPFPKLSTSIAYYKRNMYAYNFGCHNLNNDEGHMYVWDETEGSRGSQEISTCLDKHLSVCGRNIRQVIAYSDACTGQNRNVKVALSWMKMVQNPESEIELIDHKFLVSGHSFLPNDRDFGAVETAGKKAEIYLPEHWYETIKTARRNKPFKVHKMERDDFLSTSNLEKAITKRKVNEEKIEVNWLKMQWMQFRKNSPYKLFYKESLNDIIQFDVLNLKPARGRPKNFWEIYQERLYPRSRPVTGLKKKDMLDLLPYIPPVHHSFFTSLKSDDNGDDVGPLTDEEV